MIEDKKVFLVKVDTLKNTTDALTKFVSSEKFSWCRETMGVSGLEKLLSSPMERKQKVGECWVVLYSLDPLLGWANLLMVFGPWFWTRWFSVHGIGCFSMYKYVF